MRKKLRKPVILSDGNGWLIYDHVGGGSASRCVDGKLLIFPSRDAARRFLGLAPGRRGEVEDSSCSEDIGGPDVW